MCVVWPPQAQTQAQGLVLPQRTPFVGPPCHRFSNAKLLHLQRLLQCLLISLFMASQFANGNIIISNEIRQKETCHLNEHISCALKCSTQFMRHTHTHTHMHNGTQTMLSISTTLIKRHLQLPQAAAEIWRWVLLHAIAVVVVAAAVAASFAIKCMTKSQHTSAATATGTPTAAAFRHRLHSPRHSKA